MKDEIWRPGYRGPPPVSGEIAIAGPDSSPIESASPARAARPRAAVAVGAAVVVSMVIVGVVTQVASSGVELQGAVDIAAIEETVDDGPQPSIREEADFTDGQPLQLRSDSAQAFGDVVGRRMPSELGPLWTTELPPVVADGGTNAASWAHAVDDRYVVVGVGDLRTLIGPAEMHVLDASTGDSLWVRQVETRIDQVEVVAAIDEALVVTIGSEVEALDLRSGDVLWSARLAKVDGGLQQVERLDGTGFLARFGPGSDDTIDVIRPSTGVKIGELTGSLLGGDERGRWTVLRGDKLLGFDLGPSAVDADGSTPTFDGELLATIDVERNRVAAVIGDSLVTTVNGMLATGPLEVDGERVVGNGGLTPVAIDLGTPAWLLTVRAIIPLGGSAFAAVGSGSVIGAEVVDGSIRFAWQRSGVVMTTYPTERGVVLLLGTEGGSAQTLVDASTGTTIAPLTMAPGLFDSLDVVANGIVTRRTSPTGVRIAGLDLDGTELWSLDGSTPVSVGDGIVARSMPQPDGSFVVTAFGDPIG